MSAISDGIGSDGVEQLDENLRKWFKEKWVRFGPDGKIRGACARGDDSEGKPKCLPQKKAQSLGKKGRKYAAAKKRREDPNPERRGKAKNVATKKKSNEDIQVNEKWSKKYKDSINCSNPKGFSQKAHCAGKKKNEAMNEGIPFNQCPECRGPIVHESMINEKKDACYHKVKARYKVWPSAYASGALVQCRKKGAKNWGNKSKSNESSIMKGIVDENSVIVGHDANDPEVAVLGGAGTMSLSILKKKAQGEAEQLANDLARGRFKAAAYNIKQLENTLATIKAAEDEMEKGYFGEDYTGEYAAEKTPAINPYGGLKDRQHRGAISEEPTDNPTGASGEGGWRKYKPKPAGELEEACWKGYHKEGNKKMFGKTYPNCVKNTNEEQVDEREMSPELKAAQQNLIAIRNKQKAVNIPSKKERIAKDKVEIDKPKPASIFTKGSQETDPDTMDAIAAFLAKGGEIKKGRPGKAPPVGRSLASKHIGGAGSFKRKGDRPGLGANYRGDKIVQVEEEQLDEKCWDTHKQVGMKNKGGKQVPNCVPKESAIMKGLRK